MPKKPSFKIVHVVDYFQPQLGYQETALARAHARQGHNVYILTSDRYFPFEDYDTTYKEVLGERIVGEKEVEIDGYKIIRLKPKFEFKSFVFLPQIKEKLLAIKPDIVILHNLLKPNSYFVLKANKLITYKLISDSHAAEYNTTFDNPIKNLYLKFWKRFVQPDLLKSSRIITTGINEDKYLKKLLGEIKTEIIPLGADTHKFEINYKDRFKIREELRIGNNDTLIIHAGKFHPSKKTLEVVKAFCSLHNQKKRVKLLLIGNGSREYVAQIREVINNNHCNECVIHKNFVNNEELNRYLSAADIGVWPGSKSNTFIEAISNGLPIIIEDKEYAREIVKNHNGFNVKNSRELVEKLDYLVKRPVIRNKMGMRGRKLAQKHYAWSKIAQDFLEFN